MSHDVPVLRELVILAGVSLVVLLLFQRLRLPAIIGFMATGVLIGPGGFGLIRDTALIHTLAEFGVVLLLFMVGLEFSLADLKRLGRSAFLAGALQVGLTIAVVAGLLVAAGFHPATAIHVGMLVSLSSTAVVLKLLADRLELSAPHGRLATGVLIFQDLAAIAFLLVTPSLARWMKGEAPAAEGALPIAVRLLATIVAAGLAVVVARRAIPWLLARASRAGSREAFLFGVVLVALGAAYLTARMGASLAIGAFVAGLILAESDLRTRIASDVLPFRDAFASVFFVAIGMSLIPAVLLRDPGLVLASTAGLVVIKWVVSVGALRLARAPWRVAIGAGLALAQIGEFSFVVAQSGLALGLMGEAGGQAFAAGAVFSLMLTPFLVARAPHWAMAIGTGWSSAGGGVRELELGAEAETAPVAARSDHVVIAGAGLNGRNVARVLRAVRLPHLVVDLDPAAVQAVLAEGSPVLMGDVTRRLVQEHAGVPRSRVVVLALSDPSATRRACQIARSLAPRAFIVARTRYVSEIDELYSLGAGQVIPEEFETSIEIFTSVLRQFHLPNNIVDAQVLLLRMERYGLLRGRKLPRAVVDQLDVILREGMTETFLLLQHSLAVGKSLAELELVGEAARVVAVVRGGEALNALDGDFRLRVGDTLVLTGAHADIDAAFQRLS